MAIPPSSRFNRYLKKRRETEAAAGGKAIKDRPREVKRIDDRPQRPQVLYYHKLAEKLGVPYELARHALLLEYFTKGRLSERITEMERQVELKEMFGISRTASLEVLQSLVKETGEYRQKTEAAEKEKKTPLARLGSAGDYDEIICANLPKQNRFRRLLSRMIGAVKIVSKIRIRY